MRGSVTAATRRYLRAPPPGNIPEHRGRRDLLAGGAPDTLAGGGAFRDVPNRLLCIFPCKRPLSCSLSLDALVLLVVPTS
jgi:hypothetical protein